MSRPSLTRFGPLTLTVIVALEGCASCGCAEDDDAFGVGFQCAPRKNHTRCEPKDGIAAGVANAVAVVGWEGLVELGHRFKEHRRHRPEPPRPIAWSSLEGLELRSTVQAWPCRAPDDADLVGPPAPGSGPTPD
jgi:hypothetical protein